MDIFQYFGPPILFIFCCMAAVHLLSKRKLPGSNIVKTAKGWLLLWAVVGLGVPLLVIITGYITKGRQLLRIDERFVWPFSLGLMALDGNTEVATTLMVIAILAVQNAVLYLLLAAVVRAIFVWIPNWMKGARTPPRTFP
jgi:hypothetical protein